MPRRNDIKSILIIGSGPIVIGQACEFDYSGTQAIKALREEGYRVILVNSNPATIMTDPEFADRVYIEPITPEYVEAIIARERPDAVLSTMGGQTALNTALELAEKGVFEKYGCELIGANVEAIRTAEDRDLFKAAMTEIGLESARSGIVHSVADAERVAREIGYPLIIRPSRTLGGTGGGIIERAEDLHRMITTALAASPNHQILLEESLIGWKEIELEVMRDLKDNCVIVCGIENIDPMGVHTGDSITVAPIQTLTDKEYQRLRDAAIAVMRRIGVDTGGSNVQFAINPKDGRFIIIEMNPRVSRSSALASKATGFPIAKIAAKLAVGYTLDELPNDITKLTPACFEPSIDYVVVKIPRFNFEKFALAEDKLGTQMRSVGESLAFGRCFREALQKAIYSLEVDSYGFDRERLTRDMGAEELRAACRKPTSKRIWMVAEALRAGIEVAEIYKISGIDPWFLNEMQLLIEAEQTMRAMPFNTITAAELRAHKCAGFSDRRLAALWNVREDEVRQKRHALKITPNFRCVDTCAAEFTASTPYYYASYEAADSQASSEHSVDAGRKVIILGSGPNRIGQGIEFDYCCVHAVFALREEGYRAIMVNCNPETVSTDYDISDRLYFEPLVLESVLEIVAREKASGELAGVIVQFGGQTPLKLANELHRLGVPIIGTSVASIDLAEDRKLFSQLIERLKLKQPENLTASSLPEALAAANQIGYPLMIRPSFVLGGRSMRILHNDNELREYIAASVEVSHNRPVLLDRYLHHAIEVDVDALADGHDVVIAGVMEHIEFAGIHSGDSSCSLPPQSLSVEIIEVLKAEARVLAKELQVVGLMNVQFAVMPDGAVYILEVNPRASRTVPYVSKATGTPWAKMAVKLMVGRTIRELGLQDANLEGYVAVKSPVFPFRKFEGVDTVLGPEMKSTGEVMGIDRTFGGAFSRAQRGAGVALPSRGKIFLSVRDDDKSDLPKLVAGLIDMRFILVATSGTARAIQALGYPCESVNKVREGSPHIVDKIGQGEIKLVINTPEGSSQMLDSRSIRLVATELNIPTYTTMAAAIAAMEAMRIDRKFLGDDESRLEVRALQDFYDVKAVANAALKRAASHTAESFIDRVANG
jgi:carbamoyl-phosphate synthase large subunit